jgi:hypothetical protein
MVTVANKLIIHYSAVLPALPVPEPFHAHADWRYTLMTGLLPAIPIALLLPFVPESRVWLEKRRAGTLKRPSLGELFSPQLRRTTVVTAALSACAYGAAFGALQLTPTRVVPGLPDLAEQTKALKPLRDEAAQLNQQLNEADQPFRQASADLPGLEALSGQRAKARLGLRATRQKLDAPDLTEAEKSTALLQLAALTNRLGQLEAELNHLTANRPEAKKSLLEREKIMGQLGANRERQMPSETPIRARGNTVQLFQAGGTGRPNRPGRLDHVLDHPAHAAASFSVARSAHCPDDLFLSVSARAGSVPMGHGALRISYRGTVQLLR